KEVAENRLRLKTTIESIKWLTVQTCGLRGSDERPGSKNQGNLLELVKFIASYNKDVENVVLGNAPQNAKYTSPDVQKEILRIIAKSIQQAIHDEIGNAKFCLIVDESRDESKKEQMAIMNLAVNLGEISSRSRISDLEKISFPNLGGYDEASNMRGEWNGLQALILKECPYAYYVHCFAHQLQLALALASKEVAEVHKFFKNLNIIVNVISSSCKRNDQLIDAQVAEITHLVEIGELETRKGQNQIQNVQRPGDTRWSSHFRSICILMSLYGPAYVVLSDIAVTGSTNSQKGDASYCLEHLLSFDFIIVMHIMKEIMEITDKLCQALQHRLQDIVNVLALVSTTKTLLQKLRDEGWDLLMGKVTISCENNNISIPDMNATYRNLIQSRKKNNVTVEHHYRVDVFYYAIDRQLVELNSRFNESETELLRLTVALDPRKSFIINDICKLVMKFYPSDFTSQEKIQLKGELQHYELDVRNHPTCFF
ncbi:zinc finger MYM-type protein 1-like protein, partial [Tanacetum coccineum]